MKLSPLMSFLLAALFVAAGVVLVVTDHGDPFGSMLFGAAVMTLAPSGIAKGD